LQRATAERVALPVFWARVRKRLKEKEMIFALVQESKRRVCKCLKTQRSLFPRIAI